MQHVGSDGSLIWPLSVVQVKRSKHAQRKVDARNKERALDPYLDDQFTTGRLFACIASRPGQCGRADG